MRGKETFKRSEKFCNAKDERGNIDLYMYIYCTLRLSLSCIVHEDTLRHIIEFLTAYQQYIKILVVANAHDSCTKDINLKRMHFTR